MLRSLGFAEDSHQSEESRAPQRPSNSNARPTIAPPISPLFNDLGLTCGPLITKLRNFVELSRDDVHLLERLCRGPRTYAADQNLILEGPGSGFVCLIVSGWAYRYKMLRNGHRQILGFLIPGDICDLSFLLIDNSDYSVSVLDNARIVKLPIAQLTEAIAKNANVRRALQLTAHLDSVIIRQWLVNIGQRTAHQRLSYFLYEMTERLRMLGEGSEDGSFEFPLSQSVLADTIGTTPVHINRTLQRLRAEGVIDMHRRYLKILDVEKLVAIANFEGNYLNSMDYVL